MIYKASYRYCITQTFHKKRKVTNSIAIQMVFKYFSGATSVSVIGVWTRNIFSKCEAKTNKKSKISFCEMFQLYSRLICILMVYLFVYSMEDIQMAVEVHTLCSRQVLLIIGFLLLKHLNLDCKFWSQLIFPLSEKQITVIVSIGWKLTYAHLDSDVWIYSV